MPPTVRLSLIVSYANHIWPNFAATYPAYRSPSGLSSSIWLLYGFFENLFAGIEPTSINQKLDKTLKCSIWIQQCLLSFVHPLFGTPTPTRLCIPAALISSVESCNQCCSTLFAFAQNFLIISIWKANQKLCVLCKTVIFHKSLGQRVTNKSRGRSAGEVWLPACCEWWEMMMEEASGAGVLETVCV